jgi:hypothetical protein
MPRSEETIVRFIESFAPRGICGACFADAFEPGDPVPLSRLDALVEGGALVFRPGLCINCLSTTPAYFAA